MTKTRSKRKTRSDKFPLTLHPTGQYCKKIRGKLYYFGTNKKQALKRYLEQAASLHAGKPLQPESGSNALTIKMLCNMYLDHQAARAAIGEIKARHLYDQTVLLRDFAGFVGPDRLVSEVSTMDLQLYRKRLIATGKALNTVNNRITAVKSMYHWGLENEVIDVAPRLRAIKKTAPKKNERPIFTDAQINKLLETASEQMKAMILLGLNCGFGCTDCAELRWKHLDLKNGRVSFPRGKTGIRRNLPLWPETIQALKALPRRGELVFCTKRGNPWVRAIKAVDDDGSVRYSNNNEISKAFSKLMKKAGIQAEKGVGFYTLRRTAATLAARSGDPFAVQRLLGHADLKMATTYVQDVSEQTDRVVNQMRQAIIQDNS